ncbi:serine/arginine-rich splicing factor SR45-like isoform X2 [Hordeum vulgare subsp. vulgare]|uniref:serine/arginine-rich splicing factor SR45-like isoform X2 n=1 Tax=Hordeum vulgare subsp. vulgare TaxID=112509 RepID=UPI001D1A52F7|nr:serine/arginine-rich splicing factor SR45-like isoform X2 [Hordeum vulgare subsp. vulgare]
MAPPSSPPSAAAPSRGSSAKARPRPTRRPRSPSAPARAPPPARRSQRPRPPRGSRRPPRCRGRRRRRRRRTRRWRTRCAGRSPTRRSWRSGRRTRWPPPGSSNRRRRRRPSGAGRSRPRRPGTWPPATGSPSSSASPSPPTRPAPSGRSATSVAPPKWCFHRVDSGHASKRCTGEVCWRDTGEWLAGGNVFAIFCPFLLYFRVRKCIHEMSYCVM